ncbi:MAG: hypothetical protein ABIH24_08010 [Verrucomicrobiota bacterium]
MPYVKHNFLAGRPIGAFSSLNPAVEIWLEQIANVRIHGRTRRRPVDLFMAEKSMLKPLPPHPYDCASINSALSDRQFRVSVDGNRYRLGQLKIVYRHQGEYKFVNPFFKSWLQWKNY